ncbi:MAG: hypothetical protein Q9170_000742 [Blastenia crenularia]
MNIHDLTQPGSYEHDRSSLHSANRRKKPWTHNEIPDQSLQIFHLFAMGSSQVTRGQSHRTTSASSGDVRRHGCTPHLAQSRGVDDLIPASSPIPPQSRIRNPNNSNKPPHPITRHKGLLPHHYSCHDHRHIAPAAAVPAADSTFPAVEARNLVAVVGRSSPAGAGLAGSRVELGCCCFDCSSLGSGEDCRVPRLDVSAEGIEGVRPGGGLSVNLTQDIAVQGVLKGDWVERLREHLCDLLDKYAIHSLGRARSTAGFAPFDDYCVENAAEPQAVVGSVSWRCERPALVAMVEIPEVETPRRRLLTTLNDWQRAGERNSE